MQFLPLVKIKLFEIKLNSANKLVMGNFLQPKILQQRNFCLKMLKFNFFTAKFNLEQIKFVANKIFAAMKFVPKFCDPYFKSDFHACLDCWIAYN